MSFMDKLGGLAGGLAGGLNQVQQNKETQKRQRQLEHEMMLRQQAAALQEAQAQYGAMEEGAMQDPNDPVIRNIIGHLGAGAFVKGQDPTRVMKKMNPQTQMAEAQRIEYEKGASLREAERGLAVDESTAKQKLLAMYSEQYGSDWRKKIPSMPLSDRTNIGAQLYGKKDLFLTPQEELQFSPTVGAARETAAGMRDYREGQLGNLQYDNQAKLSSDYNIWLQTDEGKLASIRNKGNQQALQAEWLQSRRATGLVPPTSNIKSMVQIP